MIPEGSYYIQSTPPPHKTDSAEMRQKVKAGIQYLRQQYKLILAGCVLGAIAGLLYAYIIKPEYVATSTFVLEEKSSSGGGMAAYAGLASQLGISLGSDLGGQGGVFQGDNIIELYKSRHMLMKTLLTPVSINGKKQLLIDRYIQTQGLREKWQDIPLLKNISFNNPKSFTRLHDSIITAAVNRLNKKYLSVFKPDKKLSIINATVTYPDEIFAKLFNQNLVDNVNQFYIATKTKKSTQNVKTLQFQADSVRRLLNHSMFNAAAVVDPNLNPFDQTLKVPAQRKQIDVQTNSALYSEIIKNLSLSQITMRQETPLIQLIDEPVLPLKKEKAGYPISIAVGLILGFLIASGLLVVRKLLL